jgi:hypothetical protein
MALEMRVEWEGPGWYAESQKGGGVLAVLVGEFGVWDRDGNPTDPDVETCVYDVTRRFGLGTPFACELPPEGYCVTTRPMGVLPFKFTS